VTQYILAVDPGVTSGAVTWYGDAIGYGDEYQQIDLCDYADFVLRSWHTADIEAVVVCEAYRITQETMRKTRQTASLEIIGALRWLAAKYGHEFVLQGASEAKRFMTDAKLRHLGWYCCGTLGHMIDALRHLGLYLAKQGNQEVLSAGRS
jgi:hypothetical protein